MKREKKDYIILEDMEFGWNSQKIKKFDQYWNDGVSLWDIARIFEKDPDEISLVAMDRLRNEAISERKGGAFGRRLHERNKILGFA